MKYRCIKKLCIAEYDGDGFSTGKYNYISEGSVWEVDTSPYRIVGDNDTIHLDSVGEVCQWLEILETTLAEHFEPIN